MKMDPISRKKTSVSPYTKKDTPESPPSGIPGPDPISKHTVVAPEPPETFTDIETVDRRVEALIDYLEKWIQVGNLKMTDIKDYIQNYHN